MLSWTEFTRRVGGLPPPIVMFNKSHSGSRLLATMLRDQGVFMGAILNESMDALPFLPFVERVVLDQHPEFPALRSSEGLPPSLLAPLAAALDAHLAGHTAAQRWGFKLCETTYALPVLARAFPGARFVHLLRNGLDVAFSDHVAPESPFWRKIYFGTDRIRAWQGMALDHAAYERRSHLYNALHWQESVRVARAYGAMLGPAWREIRYEDFCADPLVEARSLLQWLDLQPDEGKLAVMAARVSRTSIGKHARERKAHQHAVKRLIEAALLSAGYGGKPLDPDIADRIRALVQRVCLGLTRRWRAIRRE